MAQFRSKDAALQRHQRIEESLRRQIDFYAIITRTLARFASCSAGEVDDCIHTSLGEIGRFAGVDSAFVLLLVPDGAKWSASYNWVAPGIPDLTQQYQDMPMGQAPWSESKIMAGEAIIIKTIDDYPAEAVVERKHFERDGAQSALLMPIQGRGGRVVGCLGFRSYVQQMVLSKDDLPRIRIVSEAIANGLERKAAEDALRHSELRYREVFQNSSDCIFIVDVTPDGRFKYLEFNPAEEQSVGYSTSQVSGKFIEEALPAEVASQVGANYRRCVEVETAISYDEEIQLPVGTRFYYTTLIPVRNPAGRIYRILGVARDITDLKNTEMELRESREHYRTLFESAGDAIFLMKNNTFIECNQKSLDLYGCTREQMIGNTPIEFSPPMQPDGRNSRDKALEKINLALEGNPQVFEWKHTKYDGTLFEAEVSLTKIELKTGPHILAIVRDITKRKQAETALRKSETRFKDLANSLPQIIYEMDEEGYVTFANQNAYDLLMYTQKDIDKGLNVFQMLIPEDRDRAIKNLQKRLDGEDMGPQEYTAVRKNGSSFPVTIHINIITHEGKYFGARGIMIDDTKRKQEEEERKNLENQLIQAQKMEAIGTLAGGVAHDFNNILGAIIGYTEIANLQVTANNEAKESLKEVLNAGRRARDLVKQILAFSRKGEQERIPIQIDPIVKEALKLLRSSLPTTIEIRQNIEGATGIVEADPTQIHQILMNLCTNASHAMREEGGILEVAIRNVEIGSWDLESGYLELSPGPYLLLSVSDTGQGMTPEVLERIFEPYYTTKEKGEGTGLGLSVVHGIVKDYGGTIRAYSELGKGSTFHVYLPVIQKKAEEVPEVDEVAPIPTRNEHILFIDDEPVLVKSGKQMLERLGYRVTTRTSSIEALELFKSKPDQFDLVITDMTMPSMTGEKLAGELMKIRSDISIIICTGFSWRMSEEKAKKIGIKAFIMKPIVMGDLAKVVRNVLENK